MTAVYLGSWPAGSEPWLAARANGIGGSEVAAIVGLSPFESPFSLHHRKAGNIEPVQENDAMRWGHRLEAPIADEFAERHPEFAVITAGTYCHAERPWQIVNPDRLLMDRALDLPTPEKPLALLEIKTSRYGDDWGDEPPPYVRCQTIYQMDVMGVDRCHVAVLIAGQDFREFVVEYDAAEAEYLRDAARGFLDDLEAGVLPPIDGHEETWQAVRELHPDISPDDAHIPDELARGYLGTYELLKMAETTHRMAKSELADFMGDARRARWRDHTIATRQARQGNDPHLVVGRTLPEIGDAA